VTDGSFAPGEDAELAVRIFEPGNGVLDRRTLLAQSGEKGKNGLNFSFPVI